LVAVDLHERDRNEDQQQKITYYFAVLVKFPAGFFREKKLPFPFIVYGADGIPEGFASVLVDIFMVF
jgi:hypothetical protein